MKKALTGLSVFLLILTTSCKKADFVKIAVTTDVHGMIYPVDLIERTPSNHSLAHVMNYLENERKSRDTSFILLDNGDFLQGQPGVYYFNTKKRDTLHISAQVMNYMGYDAGSVGNHDIETGPSVYYKIEEELDFPWLAANAIDIKTGNPGFEPYAVIRRGGRKIAVLGLITPGIPNWLPRSLWPDLRFEDMIETAHKWIPIIREKENPDVIIGLFHSGTDPTYGGKSSDEKLNENASLLVAEQVPGFDIIIAGHDHKLSKQWVMNSKGDSVLVIDPGSHARYVGEILIEFGKKQDTKIKGRLINSSDYQPNPGFLEKFGNQLEEIELYLSDTVTLLTATMHSRDGLFGPSSFITLIHKVQLKESGAEISMTAPLSFNTSLAAGPVRVSDMFKLYRFENMLYTMKLTGKEIDGFLEHGIALWFNNMKSASDHLLKLDSDDNNRLKNPYYNFSSAAGIDYTIDLAGTDGDRVTILQKSDGGEFLFTDTLLVAVNSYRGNGGGGHLTKGSGIPMDSLANRVISATDIDLRYYLMQYLTEREEYVPDTFQNWVMIPSTWHQNGENIDREILFN